MVSKTEEITVELDYFDVTLEVTVTAYLDDNYGADVDGNRGVSKWIIDEISYEGFDSGEVYSDCGELLSPELKELLDQEITSLVEEWDFSEEGEW
jgi:hypothetical protein